MALHIRDFRQSDTAGLAQLSETGRVIGRLPAEIPHVRVLVGLRGGQLAGATWLGLDGESGRLIAIALAPGPTWQSDTQALIAEACLWLTSRGAGYIDLPAVPKDPRLLAGLREMQFAPDIATGCLRRLIPSQSTA